MKGLLIKDFRLMKVQKSFFILMFAVGIGQALLSEDASSAIGFPTFIVSLFAISSISYDEFDNGNAFLFSLPITRSEYVAEKYCFGIILGGGVWALSSAVIAIVSIARNTAPVMELLVSTASILPIMLILLAVMIPVQLKFGGEKSRVALLVAFGCIVVLGLAVTKAAEMLDVDLFAMLDRLPVMSLGAVIGCAVLIALLALAVSMGISLAVIKRKQF